LYYIAVITRRSMVPVLARLLIILSFFVIAIQPAVVRAQENNVQTFQEQGFGDQTARTMFGSLNYFFPIPRGQRPVPGSELELVFSHSPLLEPTRSTLTVVVNGQSISSIALSAATRERGSLGVPLPVAGADETFAATGYFVQLQFYLRLTRDECEETNNPAQWATVHRESTIRLLTERAEFVGTLADLPVLFAPAGPDDAPVTFVLPDTPAPELLEAAGLAALELGRWAATGMRHPRLALADEPPADGRAIQVVSGQETDAPLEWGQVVWDNDRFLINGTVIPTEHGLLAIAGEEAPQLLIGGGTPEGVVTAAQALARSELHDGLAGDHLVLRGPLPGLRITPRPWQDGAASFAQLGIDAREVQGPGEHFVDLFFERPPGWTLREGSRLELAIATSTAIRPDTSWVVASVNGYVLGTHRLEASSVANERRYQFELPVGLLNTTLDGQPVRDLALQLRFFLDIPQSRCETVAPESASVIVLPTSAWILPHDQATAMDLGRFPAPLLDGDAPLHVVLPGSPSTEEMEAGLQVMAAIGRWSYDQSVVPRLVTANQVDAQLRRQGHLVLLGEPGRNPLLAEAANQIPSLAEVTYPVAYRAGAIAPVATLHLARSPWSRAHTVLAIQSDSPDGLRLAAQALGQRETLLAFRGQSLLITTDMALQTLEPAAPPPGAPEELAPQVIIPITERLQPWQVVAAILLGAFVSALILILLVRYRWRGG
jgi:cellulose synthase operon protein B